MGRICLLALVALTPHTYATQTPLDARALLQAAMDHWRGQTSQATMSMIIKRPDWRRTMTMQSWTRGEKLSLVRVLEPKKDAGNGTLLNDQQMWTYSPKINRIIKIPSSMMNQSWMGSDFSNKDISKSTDILDQYEHQLTAVEERDGHKVYVITAIPHEEAAVVWGKEVLLIRDDYVMLEEQFWDQDGELVKTMTTLEIRELDGRPVATRMRMQKRDYPDEWTEMLIRDIDFDVELGNNLFTLSNLRNPRQR
ncbi:outer membrane lipoprotein-sorting protein [Pseudomaricurvus alkylphenolicus]|nr:outer membrane lipoprotein-sorting protein [Pseudomaricurvus alkylphenolicus]